MVRLTRNNRKRILEQNAGFTERTYYDSKNHTYEREYRISGDKLYIREIGKTSWSDSRYDKEWTADNEETHRFLYNNLWKLNTDGLE